MNLPQPATNIQQPSPAGEINRAVNHALALIPPLFPLRNFVAVNPFLGLSDLSFEDAAARLLALHGQAPLLSAAEYRALYASGEITTADLEWVSDGEWSASKLLAALEAPPERSVDVTWTVVEALQSERPEERWSEFVRDEISKWCSTYFDQNQTTWKLPWAEGGLYLAFRAAAAVDRSADVHGLRTLRRLAADLPDASEKAVQQLLRELGSSGENTADFVCRQLSLVSGWAGYCRYLVREQELRGGSDAALLDLLAIRLTYDVALLRARPEYRHLVAVRHRGAESVPIAAVCRWQRAYEVAWQRALGQRLVDNRERAQVETKRPQAQVVFCIDVRSEVFRRHLEVTSTSIQTLGFAGFFGFALSHQRSDGSGAEARCPALLVPGCESAESGLRFHEAATRKRTQASTWKAIQNAAASCFSLVETTGVGFIGRVLSLTDAGAPAWRQTERPQLLDGAAADLDALAARAEGALRNMSLTRNFGRLLLLCGHGSHSANNPFASGLDCGACGGHAGDVNARIAAQALNHPGVRQRLAAKGIRLDDGTWVLAGVHNTMTDEVDLFDLELVPESHGADVLALQMQLAQAGEATRRERAPSLGIESGPALLQQLRSRAAHIAETRPEWGLAGNAALIVAPRATSAGLHLKGRTFLHDYRHQDDEDGSVLALILSAPVVVASWINLQYFASRVDPAHYGSGNKVLHNVVGGIGVFEGNGGDLRVGLPLQSLHDGDKFVHEPRRLSVFIEAPREKVLRALAALPAVRKLFDGGWIHLLIIDEGAVHAYSPSGFRSIAATQVTRQAA